MIPVTVPEVRRRLAMLLLSPAQQQHRLHWSRWRQRQAEARRSHYKRRLTSSIFEVPL